MSLPRHILMTTDSVGGVWTYSLELVRALARYGIRVTLFTEGRPLTRSQRFAVSSLMNCNVHETGHRLEWMPEPWAEVDAAGAELQALAERVQPDLVHLNGYAHAALPWSQPLLVVAHSCVYSWFDAVRSTAPGTGWGEYWRRTRSALGRAQAVVAPSRAMVEAIEKHYGPVERITVIHNAASGRDFRAAEKQPFVLAAGRLWDEAKNLRALLEAAPGIPWPVRIAGPLLSPVGSGEMPAELARVTPLGELTRRQLAREMGCAAIFAAPARYEPFGLAALEAALSGCALILGDIASQREIWGDAAIFVRPEDSGALCAAVNRLIEFPGLRELYAARALRRARRYCVAKQVRRYLAVYRQVLASRPPASVYVARSPAPWAQAV